MMTETKENNELVKPFEKYSAGTFVDRPFLDRINPFTPFSAKKFVPSENAKKLLDKYKKKYGQNLVVLPLDEKYKKLGEWHEALQTEAISESSISMHTGQQFAFPDTKRLNSGSASNAPAIKNYPVQGIAGGCIVPLALITLTNSFATAGLKSLIVNTVHDSIVIDVFPGEEFICATLTHDAMTGVPKVYEELYNVKWTVPLDVDVEIGQNWLEMETFDLT